MVKEIPLSRGLVALVDDDDFDRVAAVGKWYANPCCRTFYARKNYWLANPRRCVSLRMHTLITGWPVVDHINNNGLDNRRANLRPATDSQNSKNRQRRSDNTSGFKGVSWRKDRQLWQAEIGSGAQRRYLGMYPTPFAAAIAYDIAAREIYGEFAHLNFPTSRTEEYA